ncbi:MAG TPA: ferritin-like domain-containing protein [Mycobacterium sp.]|nr:ferritin-like domain-containing protein [Mycobacterium sp.]
MFDAVATEHGVIYGYGLVSAHSAPEVNDIVAEAMAAHRKLREDAIARLTDRDVTAPLPAIGYEIPIEVNTPQHAAQLATRMEEDSAVAWRAVLEQATTTEDRAFAVTALTQAAVTAAKWRAVLGTSPSTVAFPGGTE